MSQASDFYNMLQHQRDFVDIMIERRRKWILKEMERNKIPYTRLARMINMNAAKCKEVIHGDATMNEVTLYKIIFALDGNIKFIGDNI